MPLTLIPLRAILGVSQIGIKSQGYREPDTVMSDSEDSTVTYPAVSSPFEDRSDIGSPGVDGPPIMPEDPYAYIVAAYQAPPSPDYMPGPEEPQSLPQWTLANKPEITPPPQKRLGIDLGLRCKMGESSVVAAARPIGGRRADYGFVGTMDTEIRRQRAEEVGYRIRDVWVDPREAIEEVAPITLKGVNTRVTELAAVQEQDTQDIYAVIGDTWDRQTQIYQRVETLGDDSHYHYETARLLDQEALVFREAWGRSIEVSYMARSEIMALHSVVMSQQAVISQLQAADRRSQTVTLKMLQADHMRQAEIATL
ncbi:hypothetical protein Tco_0574342, partial [Tanacetum coccineum]